MLKQLWQGLTDAVSMVWPNFIDPCKYYQKEVGGRVLCFLLQFADTQIAFPDIPKIEQHRRLHNGMNPPGIRDCLRHIETLSDEELARKYGLLRDSNAYLGYRQPFYITRDGVVDSATGSLVKKH